MKAKRLFGKKRVVIAILSCVAVYFLLPSSNSIGKEMYHIVSGAMAGNMYRLLAGASKILNEEVKDAQFVVRTGGPKENVLLLENGDAMIAATCAHNYVEVHPEDPKLQKTTIRLIWPLFPALYEIVVPENSTVRTLDDLRGKKMTVGIKTSEGGDFLKMAKALGWTEKDTANLYYMNKGEGIAAFKEGTVEAFGGWSGIPSPIFLELATSKRGARVVALTPEEVKKIQQVYPFFVEATIPAGSHEKIKQDARTVQAWYHLCAREELPEKVAYEMAKAWDTRLKDIAAMYKPAKDATAESVLKYSFFVVHPGTMKYLREKGLAK